MIMKFFSKPSKPMTDCTALTKLLSLLSFLAVVSACNGNSTVQTNSPSESTMQFQLPDRIRNSQAVNRQATRASIDTNVGPATVRRVGDRFEAAINVPQGTTLTYTMTIYEQVGNQRIVYVTGTGSSEQAITDVTALTISNGEYNYPDDDNDGFSNFDEREAGSDHANPQSTPDNPVIPNSAGQVGFINPTAQVEEGEQVQLTIARTGGSIGSISVSISSPVITGFTITPQTLTWPDGNSDNKTVVVRTENNTASGDGQTVQLTLNNPTGGATISNPEIDLTILDITVVVPPPFPTLATDGEWEVCNAPYNTAGPSPFATQLSATENRIVDCIKICNGGVVVDPYFNGWAWMPTDQHSCVISESTPGTYTKVPVYTPRREQFALNLNRQNFINTNNSSWVCDEQSRTNLDYSYVISTNNQLWFQFSADGTYQYAVTTNSRPPAQLLGPEVWSVNGRVLELSHINTGYRNIVFFEGNQSFHIHPDTDGRLRCTKQD